MTKRRCLVIVNPQGGGGRGVAILADVKRAFAAAGGELDAHVTKQAGHAKQLGRELALDGYDGLCIIGGDGTVHEVVGGLMLRKELPRIPLGVIPAGTGNTLTQDLHCADVAAGVRAILSGKTRWLDICEVSTRQEVICCVNIVGWGGVADINVQAERLRAFGGSRYAVASLLQIVRPKVRRAKLTLDDDVIEDDFHFVIACVTRSTGTRMLMAPDAQIDDGKVDVVVLRKATRIQMLQLFRHVYDGSHVKLPFVEYRQVRSFAIEGEESQLNLDGEVQGTAPFTAKVIPRALRVFCNA